MATHSYNFAKYLEILRNEKEQVKFHTLYKGSSEMPEMPEILKKAISDDNNRTDEVYGNSAFTMEELQPNHIMLADEELLDMVYDDLVRGK